MNTADYFTHKELTESEVLRLGIPTTEVEAVELYGMSLEPFSKRDSSITEHVEVKPATRRALPRRSRWQRFKDALRRW